MNTQTTLDHQATPLPAGNPSEQPAAARQRTGLAIAAEAALVELNHCPTARAIHDLEIALAEERLKEGGVFDPSAAKEPNAQ